MHQGLSGNRGHLKQYADDVGEACVELISYWVVNLVARLEVILEVREAEDAV
jgi:hypothetical protein